MKTLLKMIAVGFVSILLSACGGTSATCGDVCQKSADAGCDTGATDADVSECTAACQNLIDAGDDCSDQYQSLIDCMDGATLTCEDDGSGQTQPSAGTACTSESASMVTACMANMMGDMGE